MVAHSSKSPGVEILTALRNGCLLPSVQLLRGALDDLELELATIGLTLYLRAGLSYHCLRYYVTDQNAAEPAQLLRVAWACTGDPTKAWWLLHRVRFIKGLVVFCLFAFLRERDDIFTLEAY